MVVAVFVTLAVSAAPVVVTRLGKNIVVETGPGVAPGKYTEQNDVKSKFALTVTLVRVRLAIYSN